MKRIKQVDKLVWRGSHPITDEDFLELQAKGIKLIINLESGLWERFKGDINYEVELAAKYDIPVIHLHMNYFMPPKKHELETALLLIKSCTDKSKGVYFHCYSGVDRTGAVAAAYRVKVQEFSVDEAMDEMIFEGHQWILQWWDGITRKNLEAIQKEKK